MDPRRLLPLGLLALALVAGCGEQGAPAAHDAPRSAATAPDAGLTLPTVVPASSGEVSTRFPVTVLEDGSHGAEACLGGVEDSLPPQCTGVPLRGWDWSAVSGSFQERGGTRWGDFVVQGVFDGSALGVTRATPAAVAPSTDPGEGLDPALITPCPPPEGGWHVVDPGTTTTATLDATMSDAERLDGFADDWVDQSINPAWAEVMSGRASGEAAERALNDPTLTIIDVRVTHDPAVAEALLRRTWGGSLCVTTAANPDALLARAQNDLDNQVPGFMGSGRSQDQVQLQVTFDDGSLQRLLDRKYGAGVVQVFSELAPVG